MGRKRSYSDEQIIEAVKTHPNSVYAAAFSLGCTVQTIYNRLSYLGMSAQEIVGTSLTLSVENQIMRYVQEGESFDTVARKLNLPHKIVRDVALKRIVPKVKNANLAFPKNEEETLIAYYMALHPGISLDDLVLQLSKPRRKVSKYYLRCTNQQAPTPTKSE